MTISPIFTIKEGLIFNGEYRQKFSKGELFLAGSATEADRREGDPTNPQTKKRYSEDILKPLAVMTLMKLGAWVWTSNEALIALIYDALIFLNLEVILSANIFTLRVSDFVTTHP